MIPEYKIITDRHVHDDHYYLEEDWSEKLWQEQEDKCEEIGLDTDYLADEVQCNFFDSPFFDECTEYMNIYDAIQCLAIKDGVDLVQYSNKNYGFVAYYNGNVNGFEVIK